MKRVLRILMLAAVMALSLCLCAEAEVDWTPLCLRDLLAGNHPAGGADAWPCAAGQ